MISIVAAIMGAVIGGLCVFWYLRRSDAMPSPRQEEPALLPSVGTTAVANFICQGEHIHTLSRVEEQNGMDVMLRILVEMGRIPLLRLRSGATGHLEVGTTILPLDVMAVDFPWVHARTHAEQAQPAYRQTLRLPASFSVRFRPQGTEEAWTSGSGLDLSSEGFCFCSSSPSQPCLGLIYEIELTIDSPRGAKEELSLEAEVRWVRQTPDGTLAGAHVSTPSEGEALARAVFRLQRQLSRRPEDYLMEERPRPRLH